MSSPSLEYHVASAAVGLCVDIYVCIPVREQQASIISENCSIVRLSFPTDHVCARGKKRGRASNETAGARACGSVEGKLSGAVRASKLM